MLPSWAKVQTLQRWRAKQRDKQRKWPCKCSLRSVQQQSSALWSSVKQNGRQSPRGLKQTPLLQPKRSAELRWQP